MTIPRFSSAPAAPRAADPSGARQAYLMLRTVFTVAPVVFGLDKFFDLLTNWEQYLAPWIDVLVPGSAHQAMLAVGVVEILAGVLVAVRPAIGAYVVAAWLLGIIVNLLSIGDYYDIALRDFGLLVAALALGRLAASARPSWLDNLTRPALNDGTMAGLIGRGVRGVTANPTIVAKAIESFDKYDQQLHDLVAAGSTVEDAYWELAVTDVVNALGLLRPTFDASEGADGFVSIEVAPGLENDTRESMTAARDLHDRISEPNLLVKIPATPAGVAAIEA